jgi:hypothetical protein
MRERPPASQTPAAWERAARSSRAGLLLVALLLAVYVPGQFSIPVVDRDEARFAQIEARHVRRADDPYRVLGVSRDMTTEEIRSAWLKLVTAHHPDRALARGLPPEAVTIANERLAALNGAWERIGRERGAKAIL